MEQGELANEGSPIRRSVGRTGWSKMEVFLVVFTFILIYVNVQIRIDDHNANHCYDMISTIQIGDDIDTAIEKMTTGLILPLGGIRHSEEYLMVDSALSEYSVVIFRYSSRNDPWSSYPKIYYSPLTGKVVRKDSGIGLP
jgi:hypothetical protein